MQAETHADRQTARHKNREVGRPQIGKQTKTQANSQVGRKKHR